ncbi:MAG: DNA primase [Bacteroidales bacterium]|nr:DNA primase [Bacteroidales bacterium]
MIDKGTVDRIIETAEITDVIQDFVNLKKRGTNYLGLCPFHNEKTPSFNVSPSKGIFKCFGCGKGGNAINFIMEHEHLSYPEALRYLANKYNIEIEEKEQSAEEIKEKNVRDSLQIVTNFAAKYFRENLKNNQEGRSVGLSYLKERSIREDMIDKFELGYSLDQWESFTQAALKKGFKQDYLEKTGLTIVKEDKRYDRFRGRIMFPIHSLSGNVIGFGGRTMKKDEKTAKYINSPESEIYHKSNILYGIYHAKKAITKNEKCYMVEGYTDVIALHQKGIENVVASSGTSLTENQIRLVKRFTPNITIIFDGDPAGIKASLRGIDLILEQGMNVKVLLLPDGEDPDSFSQKQSASELVKYIEENEQDFIHFKTRLLSEEAQNDPVKRANLINDVVRSISMIPDGIMRTVYIKNCSSILDIDEKVLYEETNKIRNKRARQKHRREQAGREKEEKNNQNLTSVPSFIEEVYSETQEKEIIRLLLQYGAEELYTYKEDKYSDPKTLTVAQYIIKEILNDELEFKNLIYKQIFEEYLDILNKGKHPEKSHFIYHSDEQISKLAADLLSPAYELSEFFKKKSGVYVETEDMKLKMLVPEAIIAYKRKILEKAQKDKEKELQQAQKEGQEQDKIMQLQQEYQTIAQAINSISKDRGWVVFR